MQVEQLMTRSVVSCRESDSLNQAARIMWENDCGIVPVLDDAGRIAGVVTDRDVCMAAYTSGASLSDTRVSTAWSPKVVACRPTDSLEAAEGQMRRAQVRRLLVTNESGHLVGILSLSDLARQATRLVTDQGFDRHGLALTLEAVSRSRNPIEAHRRPATALYAVAPEAAQRSGTDDAEASRGSQPIAARLMRASQPPSGK